MIVKFFLNGNESEICKCEDSICDSCFHLVSSYTDIFARYGCTMRIVQYWYNSATGMVSEKRIPFVNGYLRGISCEIFREGRIVELGEDEVALTASWFFSSARRTIHAPYFWRSYLNIVLSADTKDIEEELEEWVELLQSTWP